MTERAKGGVGCGLWGKVCVCVCMCVCVGGGLEGTRNPLVASNYVTSLKYIRNFTTNPEQPLPDK